MIPVSYPYLLRQVLPEVIVVVTALIVLMADLLLRARSIRLRFHVAAWLGAAGCAGAIARLVLGFAPAYISGGMFFANPLTQFLQIVLLVLAVAALLLSVDSTFTEHVGEFVLLVLLATTGMMFLVATENLLVIFAALELLSLSLYILTAFDKRRARTSEAALKYFLFGGMSAAFLLFGFSLLYGLSNSTNIARISVNAYATPHHPLLLIAMITTVIGFGFKVAAVPFHFWAPDVYESAPAPAAAFIASSSKVASFFVFFQMMAVGFAGAWGKAGWSNFASGWALVIAGVAALSMVLGNLVAIRQTSLRRLLAYSAIAHAGYMLVAIVAHTPQSLGALLYYVVTYALGTVGIFGVIGVVEKYTGDDRMVSFNGLSRRAPVLSVCLFIFLLSLAGIPPLAGFFGKFYLFVAALNAVPGPGGLLWLVVLAIAMSAVSLYYYVQVLKRVYVTNPPEGALPIKAPMVVQTVVVLLAAGVVLFGCAPHLLLRWIERAIAIAGL